MTKTLFLLLLLLLLLLLDVVLGVVDGVAGRWRVQDERSVIGSEGERRRVFGFRAPGATDAADAGPLVMLSVFRRRRRPGPAP